MKTRIIAVVILLSTSLPAHADLWTWSKNSKLTPKSPSAAYRVETLGLDVRIYEWTPEGNPDVTCVMAFGQTNPVGMQCFEKTENKENDQ